MLARIPADVWKRPLTFVCAAALLLAACNTIPQGTVNAGSGIRFVTQVADFADNVGLGNQVTVDSNGLPWLSYWGFPAKLKTGEIPVTRPIGSPYIPAVLITTVNKAGVWIRGAAAQITCPAPTPPCPAVPFNPATVKRLQHANADNTNGTDMVIAPDGSMDVAWTSFDGVYYGSGSSSTPFTANKLYGLRVDLTIAGPIGRPSVAVDAAGTPWVAYTVNGATQQVRVASPDSAGKWITTVVAALPQCGGCPQPGVTRIGMTSTGPVVAYTNPQAKAVMVATLSAGTWTTQRVASGVTGGGLSMAIGKDGAVYLTYYTGDAVQLASTKGGSWSTAKVADVASPPATAGAQPGVGNFAETTGVAVDDNGKIYVTWYDGQKDAVQVVSGDGTAFTPIPATNTEGGRYPSIAVAHDGSLVYVAWYANGTQDQLLGVWGNQPSYAIGYPSPTSAGVPPPSAVICGKDKTIALDEVAAGLSFKSPCLVAPAGKSFSVNFDNQDATTVHNMAFFSDQAHTAILYSGAPVTGPNQTVYQVTQKTGPLKAGTYYFQCVYHPTTMVGTLVVVAGAK
jgi:plastocyanin